MRWVLLIFAGSSLALAQTNAVSAGLSGVGYWHIGVGVVVLIGVLYAAILGVFQGLAIWHRASLFEPVKRRSVQLIAINLLEPSVTLVLLALVVFLLGDILGVWSMVLPALSFLSLVLSGLFVSSQDDVSQRLLRLSVLTRVLPVALIAVLLLFNASDMTLVYLDVVGLVGMGLLLWLLGRLIKHTEAL